MESSNGKRRKREIKSQPGECYFACEHCGDYFHHNGLGMHQHYCAERNPDDRLQYQHRKHTLRVPGKNSRLETNVPVQVRFYTDRDRERLHMQFSFADSTLLKFGRVARDMKLIELSEEE